MPAPAGAGELGTDRHRGLPGPIGLSPPGGPGGWRRRCCSTASDPDHRRSASRCRDDAQLTQQTEEVGLGPFLRYLAVDKAVDVRPGKGNFLAGWWDSHQCTLV